MTKIKICGLTELEHIQVAMDLNIDYVGFVFANSKRRIDPQKVEIITRNLPKKIKKVGVFISPTWTELERTIKEADLQVIQLHGLQSKEVEEKIANDFFRKIQIEVIQAINSDAPDLVSKMRQSSNLTYLIDAPNQGEEYMGGNGKVFNWKSLQNEIRSVPNQSFFIAGGLTSDNVQDACKLFQPYGVDVSSGVETNGRKDIEKMKKFVEKVRELTNV